MQNMAIPALDSEFGRVVVGSLEAFASFKAFGFRV